jgi:hypothetical protein
MTKNFPNVDVKKVTQIKVVLEHVPGTLAKVAEALTRADINIEGTCNMEGSDETMPLRLIVDKPLEAKKVIESLGDAVTMEECISIHNQDGGPGLIAKVARALGDASINIESIYQTSTGRGGDATTYISVDKANLDKALQLIASL